MLLLKRYACVFIKKSPCSRSITKISKFWVSETSFSEAPSKKEEELKKFKEMNEEYKKYRELKKYTIKKPGKEHFITENEILKRRQDLEKAFEDYKNFKKFNAAFQEEKFIAFISQVSYTFDNHFMLEREDFKKLIIETAEQLNQFKDISKTVLFYSFCSIQKIEAFEVWECFGNYFKNNIKAFKFNDRLMILSCWNEVNKQVVDHLFADFENDFLYDFKKGLINFSNLVSVMQVYRNLDKGSENFFYTIQNALIENLAELNIENLLMVLTHYGACLKEKIEVRNHMMKLLEERLIKMSSYFTPTEINTVLYYFVRSNMGSKNLFMKLEDRLLTIIPEFTIKEIEKIVVIYSNRPKENKGLIFKAVEKYLMENLKKIQVTALPNILFSFCENGEGSKELIDAFETTLTRNIFLLNEENVTKIVWGLSITGREYSVFFKKAEEYVSQNIKKFNMKNICTVVWSFGQALEGEPSFFQLIEEQLNQRLPTISIKEIAYIFWSYTNKVPLMGKTVEALEREITNKYKNGDAWDLSTIVWGFSRFKGYVTKNLFSLLEDSFLEMKQELNNYELSVVFRAYVETENGSKNFFTELINEIETRIESLNYLEVVTIMYHLTNISTLESKRIAEVLQKLKIQLEKLKLLKPVEMYSSEKSPEGKSLLEDIDFYLQNKN